MLKHNCPWCGKHVTTGHHVINRIVTYHSDCWEAKQRCAEVKPQLTPEQMNILINKAAKGSMKKRADNLERWGSAKPEWMIKKERMEQRELSDSFEHSVTAGIEVNYRAAAKANHAKIIAKYGVGKRET